MTFPVQIPFLLHHHGQDKCWINQDCSYESERYEIRH
jgi:hypothetical protein